jgi:hypothetical protein
MTDPTVSRNHITQESQGIEIDPHRRGKHPHVRFPDW